MAEESIYCAVRQARKERTSQESLNKRANFPGISLRLFWPKWLCAICPRKSCTRLFVGTRLFVPSTLWRRTRARPKRRLRRWLSRWQPCQWHEFPETREPLSLNKKAVNGVYRMERSTHPCVECVETQRNVEEFSVVLRGVLCAIRG